MRILHVAGARPNFMKVAPIMAAMAAHPRAIDQRLVHTGQHYDYNMSRIFFEDLAMPEPDVFLNAGSGSHAEQTAGVMLAFEPVLRAQQPDYVIVVGDVNSTLACALVCAKLGVPVAHVEAGLRSYDRMMPEEINRIVTDQLADVLFTPSPDANANLLREGIADEKIHFVGNVMIDTLQGMLPAARQRPVFERLNLAPGSYLLVTLHRPENVDVPETLRAIAAALQQVAAELPVVFPVHPRTRQRLASCGIAWNDAHMRLIEPQGYLDFLALLDSARLVLTDSGGVQEETTWLGVPCLTVRRNTERPVTIDMGTNRLVASNEAAIVQAVAQELSRGRRETRRPELWDGAAARRIVDIMLRYAPH
jgi:UDP-N-acetylglucosamine 2-epimerase (non-hydrolysing)